MQKDLYRNLALAVCVTLANFSASVFAIYKMTLINEHDSSLLRDHTSSEPNIVVSI